jgi:Cof subfamily protein (haloacid dehalogenase superfamily)
MLPRLIAIDLDGTLLDGHGELSDRSVAALHAAAAAGITMVFASGRPPQVIQALAPRIGTSVAYGVLANGTMICTLPGGEPLHTVRFPTTIAIEAVRRLRAHDARFGFALASDRGLTHEAGFFERMPVHGGRATPTTSDDVLAGHEDSVETIKLLAFHHDLGAADLLDTIPPLLGEGLSVTHMGADAVEIGPAGADKGTGLRWLCDHLGIDPVDTLVFGDELNDLAMFAVAGRAVAVANASPPVLAAAHEVAPSNADDGVAVVIERLLAEAGLTV